MQVVTLARGEELWEITWMGAEVEIARGPRSREPRVEERMFAHPAEAEAFVEAEIEARRAEGWVESEVEHDGGEAAEREAERRVRPTEPAWAMRRCEPPDEREPVTRVGGRPLMPAGSRWPECRGCSMPMQFLAQIRLRDAGDPDIGDGLLLIWHCDELGIDCAPYEPEMGANLALVCELGSDMEVLAVPDAGSHVLDRIDGVERVRLDRPLPLDPDDDTDFADDLDDDEEPYNEIRVAERGEIIGLLARRPDWIQDEQIPSCAACRRPMRPVVQLEAHAGGGINFGDVGCGYAFVCTGCRAGAFLMQCH